MLLNKQLYLLSLIMECCSNVSPASEECLLSSWSQCFQTGWLAHSRTKVWVRKPIKSFNLHHIISYISPKIFLYFSYILSFRIPIFLFFVKKVTGRPALYLLTYLLDGSWHYYSLCQLNLNTLELWDTIHQRLVLNFLTVKSFFEPR